jgi:hypothetical protein
MPIRDDPITRRKQPDVKPNVDVRERRLINGAREININIEVRIIERLRALLPVHRHRTPPCRPPSGARGPAVSTESVARSRSDSDSIMLSESVLSTRTTDRCHGFLLDPRSTAMKASLCATGCRNHAIPGSGCTPVVSAELTARGCGASNTGHDD